MDRAEQGQAGPDRAGEGPAQESLLHPQVPSISFPKSLPSPPVFSPITREVPGLGQVPLSHLEWPPCSLVSGRLC